MCRLLSSASVACAEHTASCLRTCVALSSAAHYATLGKTVHPYQLDLSHPEAVAPTLAKITSDLGFLDVVVYNASTLWGCVVITI